jgi:hypothetical protein
MALLECQFMAPGQPCSRRWGRRTEGGGPSLDKATKSPGHIDCGRVRTTVYPYAGEVVLSPLDGHRDVDRTRKPGGPRDPQRCKREASARAHRQLRRFCKEHRLCFMWTLTYGGGGQRDLSKLRRQIERLVAKVIADLGGKRFPYAYAVELHADGERLHVHMAVPFFFAHERLGVLWGHGFVWCSDKRQRGECAHVGATRAAGYLAKYVAKTFDSSEFGCHRYEVARGFKVERYQVRRRDFDDGQRYAEALFMAAPEYVWNSGDCPDWAGPPVRVLFFTPRVRDG